MAVFLVAWLGCLMLALTVGMSADTRPAVKGGLIGSMAPVCFVVYVSASVLISAPDRGRLVALLLLGVAATTATCIAAVVGAWLGSHLKQRPKQR